MTMQDGMLGQSSPGATRAQQGRWPGRVCRARSPGWAGCGGYFVTVTLADTTPEVLHDIGGEGWGWPAPCPWDGPPLAPGMARPWPLGWPAPGSCWHYPV